MAFLLLRQIYHYLFKMYVLNYSYLKYTHINKCNTLTLNCDITLKTFMEVQASLLLIFTETNFINIRNNKKHVHNLDICCVDRDRDVYVWSWEHNSSSDFICLHITAVKQQACTHIAREMKRHIQRECKNAQKFSVLSLALKLT